MVPFGTQKAPSKYVVLPFYIAAGLAFLVLSVMLLFSAADFTGHYFHPHILAITHTATLGWVTMIIFGASYQLLPVVIEVQLYSEKLAKWSFGLLLPGVILLVIAFWKYRLGLLMEAGASIIVLATILYSINVYKTATQNKNLNITAELIVTASFWLVITAIFGLLLAINLRHPFFPREHLYYLKMHAHLGMVGWFLMLIMGVGSKLIPLFLLSDHEPGNYVKVSYYCVNIAVLGLLVMGFFFNTLKYWPVAAVLVLVAAVCYAVFARRTYKEAARKRTDQPMTLTLIALGMMFLPFLLLAVLAFMKDSNPLLPSISIAYGISAIGGFVTAMILGLNFKTLPFLVWMNRYRKLRGKVKIPLP